MGNAGAAITTFIAPTLLNNFSETDSQNGWKMLPVIYGGVLVTIAILFIVFAKNKINPGVSKTIKELMSPLKNIRVWRFGAYYFLVFGFFVAYSQWLLPNFMNIYHTSLVMSGMFATMFSLPSGVIRAFGGYLSDKFGARKVMYWVLGSSIVISFLLMFPKMEIFTAGPGVLSTTNGVVTEISANAIVVNGKEHKIDKKETSNDHETAIFPVKNSWQEIVVQQNQQVKKKELLAQGITQIKFSANIWVYLVLVILIGIAWGIGKAAVYKHIPEYFPNEVGVVGGMVGLIGGLGGFIGPIIFGYLLNYTGLWTSSWIFIFIVSVLCLLWMHRTIINAMRSKSPNFTREIEDHQ
jgi:NNP family nitrate/nitrite transporter-like MFS transporter